MARELSTREAMEILLRASTAADLQDSQLLADPRGLLSKAEIDSRKNLLSRTGYGATFSLVKQDLVPFLEAMIDDGSKVDDFIKKLEDETNDLAVLLDWATSEAEDASELVPDEIIEMISSISDQVESRNMTLWRKIMARYFSVYVQDPEDFQQTLLNIARNLNDMSATDRSMFLTITKIVLGVDYADLVPLAGKTHARRVRMLQVAGIPTRYERIDYDSIVAARSRQSFDVRAGIYRPTGSTLVSRIVGDRKPTVDEARSVDVLRGLMSDRALELVIDVFRSSKGGAL